MINLTPKQEKFCKKYIELGNASEAYREAYNPKRMANKTIWEAASRLLKNSKVLARIAELQGIHQKRHEVTVDSLTDELEQARMMAIAKDEPAPMISASMGKAKLHGLLVDRAEIAGRNGGPIELADAKAALLRGVIPKPPAK